MWHPPERIKHDIAQTRWPSEQQAADSLLYSPVRIGSVELRQRTWVPAMVPWRSNENGDVTQDVIDWYARFAAGRPGAIVVEATGIRDIPSGPLLRIGHERFIPGLRRLTEAVREASDGQTRVLIQIIDFLSIKRRPPKDKFFTRFLALRDDHRTALAGLTGDEKFADPSTPEADIRGALIALSDDQLAQVLSRREFEDYAQGYRERVTDTHLAHIADLPNVLPDLFANAAEIAFASGFDGVELHYAHAYTMASFLSALNTRDDGYGGARENRVRLPVEVIRAVRERVGTSRCVGARYLGDDVIAGGSDLNDAMYFGVELVRAGLDFLSVSKGGKFEDAKQPKVGEAVYPYTGQSGYECMPTIYSDQRGPFGRNVPLAAAIKRSLAAANVSAPVVASGGINSFELAERILRDGDADIIASARQGLADPDWFLKARLGRGDEIRRCAYTNYCEGLDQKHKQVTCKLWDRTQLDEPDVRLDLTGRRRLTAPIWKP